MHGNQWEWCADLYQPSYAGAPTDGSAWMVSTGEQRQGVVMRGGSWTSLPWELRSAYRVKRPPVMRSAYIGFRVVSPRRPATGPLPREGSASA